MSKTHAASRSERLGMYMKISAKWDLVGISAAMLTLVSFFVFMFCGPLQGVNLLLLGFGNPPLMFFYLLFSLMSFIYGYLEGKKEESKSDEERDVVFIRYDRQ